MGEFYFRLEAGKNGSTDGETEMPAVFRILRD
jgi:hypothetical protein